MAARSADMITGSSSTPNGRSTSSPTGHSGGPPRPGAPTPPNPRGTPYEERGRPAAGSARRRIVVISRGYDRLGAESGWQTSLGGSRVWVEAGDASADRRGPLAAGTAPQRGGTSARGAAGRRPA